jgi:queuine tRNA-ribosyltransferase
VGAVARGIDMFDCVAPTRSGRHGQAFTRSGAINLKNAQYAEDDAPLDPSLDCPASRDYSKAYLHHLFKAGEYLGPMLLTWHNLAYYQLLMADLRSAIAAQRLGAFVDDFRRRTGEAAL